MKHDNRSIYTTKRNMIFVMCATGTFRFVKDQVLLYSFKHLSSGM